ncbi:chemotaxis protein MotB [Brevundimonas sp. GN22]|uniref:flagellar motor protein MotB n=1 Tax=Brevundimonas pishanensis TaxID=2896315 RepID=UPI001FA745BF|nr:flagellar motor protein MotB [Brevundimonas pishanensis]
MAQSDRPILIKKVKKVQGGGHHGGAWKVAYADFVTAMMAFFLLMWLINTTDPEQKRGIAEYFAPSSVSASSSGSGGILGGTSLGDDEGAKGAGSNTVIEQLAPPAPESPEAAGQSSDLASASEAALRAEIARREAADFASAAESLRQAMQSMPELAELSKQLIIDQTPEGLRIQLVDQEGRSMFENGSARPNARAQTLLRAVARVINRLPNRITISGHTSAVAGSNRASAAGDWPLSASRADASRQILQSSGVNTDRIYSVAGKAGSDPLYPDDPSLAGNRRIAIVLLREAPVLPRDTSL